jgi:predicted NBD/HSP70 family sugar kinase
MLYVGVDAHKTHSQMTVIDETRKVLDRRRVASSREGMLQALGRYRDEPIKAVLEAGYGSRDRSTTGLGRWPRRSSWPTR